MVDHGKITSSKTTSAMHSQTKESCTSDAESRKHSFSRSDTKSNSRTGMLSVALRNFTYFQNEHTLLGDDVSPYDHMCNCLTQSEEWILMRRIL